MNTRSSIEQLESRIAPAAVTVTNSGGKLSIAGDPVNNLINIIQTGDSIEVLDFTLSFGTFTGVKSIAVKLEGESAVHADLGTGISGGLSVTADGMGPFTIATGSKIGGALTFKGEGSAQTLTLGDNVSVGTNLTFSGGLGADTFTIGKGSSIGGNATFSSVENGTFSGTSLIEIGGSLTFKNTGTPLAVSISVASDATFHVVGKLSYAGGLDNDSLTLVGTFDDGVSFTDPAGNNSLFLNASTFIHGALKMTTGIGNDGFSFATGKVDKDVTLKLGSGNNSFDYGYSGGVNIGGNLAFTGGSGNDRWDGAGSMMTLAKNLTLNLGDGTNTVTAKVNVTGTKVGVSTGIGIDSISLSGSAINAAVVISLGAGADDLVETLVNALSGHYDGGAGLDHFRPTTLSGEPVVVIGFEDFS